MLNTLLASILAGVAFCPVFHARGDVQPGDELCANPSLSDGAKGWLLRDAEAVGGAGPGGSDAVRLRGVDGPSRWSHLGLALAEPPTERELALAFQVHGTPFARKVEINAFAYAADGKTVLEQWSQPGTLKAERWVRLEAKYVLPPETARFTAWIINHHRKDVLVADVHLVAGERAKATLKALNGPGILRASAAVAVRAAEAGGEGVVTFPIPGTYREQVPLTFDLEVEPPSALQGFRWKQRADGVNWLCEVRVKPPAEGARVRWKSLVLVDDREPVDLPAAPKPEAPAQTSPWLRSTACAQAADEGVAAKAAELAEGKADVESRVRAVIEFSSQNQGRKGAKFETLDAAAALDCGGSCTSRANLCAALLRAIGIPARTVAHLPTWAGPLYEHWLVEYWHPGAGWVWVESSLGEMQPRPWTMVVINVANPEDENGAFEESIWHSGVMRGAPDLAVHKLSPELLPLGFAERTGDPDAGNWARCVLRVSKGGEEHERIFRAARAAYAALRDKGLAGELDRERRSRVEQAVASGDTGSVLAALTDQ